VVGDGAVKGGGSSMQVPNTKHALSGVHNQACHQANFKGWPPHDHGCSSCSVCVQLALRYCSERLSVGLAGLWLCLCLNLLV
jgi:hypothetical protein